MLVVELLLLLVPAALGVALLSAARALEEKLVLTAAGAVLGLALFTTVAYIVSVIVPISALVIIVLLVVAALLTIGLLTYTDAATYWREVPLDRTGIIVALVLFVLLSFITTKLLVSENGGLSTGILNAWGDLAWHMANITNFAEGQSAPPENPIYAGTRLTYPFLVNFFSALLLKLGATTVRMVVLPAFFLVPVAFILFYGLTRQLTGKKGAAIIAVILLLLAGGTLGWTRLPGDWQESTLPLAEFLQQLPRDYTGSGGDADGFHFLNPILSLLLPQRSFLFGMPLAFTILLLLTTATRRPAAYMLAGVVAGLMPLFHGHTVLALIPPIIALFIHDAVSHLRRPMVDAAEDTLTPRPWTETLHPWTLFALLAAIVGIPEVLYYVSSSNEGTSFFRWGPRWMAGEENLVWYWIKNTGLVLPAAVVALLMPADRRLKLVALSGLAIFVIANLFLFAPWAWDNSKLLIFWLLLTLPLVAHLAVTTMRRSRIILVIVILLIAAHGVSGAIDLVKTGLPTATTWGEWDADSIAMAKEIQRVTPPGSVVVTAPYHNTPVALAGRRMYLGFPGHVWSHGGSHWEREAAVQPFYEGQSELPETPVHFAVVGPVERQRYPNLTIRPDWILVAETSQQQLYRLP